MANIPLKTIKFPGLDDTYTVPEVDNTLATAGKAADAKKTGDELNRLKQDYSQLLNSAYVTETITDAAVASFSDGADNVPVKSLTVNVTPAQDLHGQANPYPAGGGKNLVSPAESPAAIRRVGDATYVNGIDEITITSTSDTNYSCVGIFYDLKAGQYAFKYQAQFSDSFTPIISIYVGSTVKSSGITPNTSVTFTLEEDSRVEIRMFTATSGNGSTGRVIKYYQMQLESGSTSTAWSPYSNSCPISGWTEAKVTRTGKNLLPESDFDTSASGNTTKVPSTIVIPKKGETIVVSGKATDGTVLNTGNCAVNYYNGNTSIFAISPTQSKVVPDLSETTRIEIFLTSAVAGKHVQIQVEYGSTATTYEPYQGETYEIDLDGTRYGCKLDVVNGVLTVDHGLFTPTIDTPIARQPGKTYYYFNVVVSGMVGADVESGVICNIIKSGPFGGGSGIWAGSADLCCLRDNGFTFYTDATKEMVNSDALQWLIDNGAQIYYPLATPLTVQLTPTEVTTLLLNNNIFADCGNVSVTYRADLKAYIDSVIS